MALNVDFLGPETKENLSVRTVEGFPAWLLLGRLFSRYLGICMLLRAKAPYETLARDWFSDSSLNTESFRPSNPTLGFASGSSAMLGLFLTTAIDCFCLPFVVVRFLLMELLFISIIMETFLGCGWGENTLCCFSCSLREIWLYKWSRYLTFGEIAEMFIRLKYTDSLKVALKYPY